MYPSLLCLAVTTECLLDGNLSLRMHTLSHGSAGGTNLQPDLGQRRPFLQKFMLENAEYMTAEGSVNGRMQRNADQLRPHVVTRWRSHWTRISRRHPGSTNHLLFTSTHHFFKKVFKDTPPV
jgi:hypothetical protein